MKTLLRNRKAGLSLCLVLVVLISSAPIAGSFHPNVSVKMTEQELTSSVGMGCSWLEWVFAVADWAICIFAAEPYSCMVAAGVTGECIAAAMNHTTSPQIPSSTQMPTPDPCPDGYQRVGGQPDGNGGWIGYKCAAL